jgi:hypothetical protein
MLSVCVCVTIDSEIHNTFALDIRFPQRRGEPIFVFAPIHVEYKKFPPPYLSLCLP